MGLIKKLFWLAVFAAATFGWVVLFQHGPSNFEEGVKVEWEKLRNLAPFERPADKSDAIAQ